MSVLKHCHTGIHTHTHSLYPKPCTNIMAQLISTWYLHSIRQMDARATLKILVILRQGFMCQSYIDYRPG